MKDQNGLCFIIILKYWALAVAICLNTVPTQPVWSFQSIAKGVCIALFCVMGIMSEVLILHKILTKKK